MKPKKDIHFAITRALFRAGEKDKETEKAFMQAVERFKNGDWGELCQDDIEANNSDLANRDGHVLGKYNTPSGSIFINLEFHDELPEDYALLMFCNEY